jgi:hypothetical protein
MSEWRVDERARDRNGPLVGGYDFLSRPAKLRRDSQAVRGAPATRILADRAWFICE